MPDAQFPSVVVPYKLRTHKVDIVLCMITGIGYGGHPPFHKSLGMRF